MERENKGVYHLLKSEPEGLAKAAGMGASSRAGESIQAVFEHAGTDTIYASKAYCLLQYTQKLEVRTGSVRTMD